LPPPSNKGCNALASIVMVVVAVVLTVVTAGAAAAALGPGLAATMAAGAAGSFVGSVGSQLAGKAMGVVDHFSLRQAVSSGIAGGLTAGLGSVLGNSTTFTKTALDGTRTLTSLGQGIQGAGAVAANAIGNKLTNQDTHFSWAAMAAGFVGGYAQGALGLNANINPGIGNFTGGSLLGNVVQGFAAGAINATANRVAGLGQQDWRGIAANSVGNAIGSSISTKYDLQGKGAAFGRKLRDSFGNIQATAAVQQSAPQNANDWSGSGNRNNFDYADDPYQIAALDGGYAAKRSPAQIVQDNAKRTGPIALTTGDDPAQFDENGTEVITIVGKRAPESQPYSLFDGYNPTLVHQINRMPQPTTAEGMNLIDRRFVTGPQMKAYDVERAARMQAKMAMDRRLIEGAAASPLGAALSFGASSPEGKLLLMQVGSMAEAGGLGASGKSFAFTGAKGMPKVVDPNPSNSKPASARETYMGSTPDKYSRTGREVVERMRNEGLIDGEGPLQRGNPNNLQLINADGTRTLIDGKVDMAHKVDAVSWWNDVGRLYGAKSPEVRQFMLDPSNYVLQHQSINRSEGAQLKQTYQPPLAPDFTRPKE